MTLQIENLNKTFGSLQAVQNLNLDLQIGGVLGLLGRNGAGKSTTLKMLLGLIEADSGTILWNGSPISKKNVSIGYLPEERGLYPKIKVGEQLRYFAELEGMKKNDADRQIAYWLERLNIPGHIAKMAGELSKGNQQLVQIAGTLIHNPDLIILDEPFSGLDPVNADILKDVIEGLVAEKKTVILSSHQMNQIETFCQDIVILNSGKTILKGALSEIKANYGFKYVKMESRDSLTDSLQEMGYDVEIKGNTYQIKLASTFDALSLGQTLMSSHNKNITSFTVQEPSLHQIFVERTG